MSPTKTVKTKSTRRLVFLAFILVILVAVAVVAAPYISQMNSNADSINQAIDAQRTQNSIR